jgi:ABC-type nickel/cobalt efflux system permease component RcnA
MTVSSNVQHIVLSKSKLDFEKKKKVCSMPLWPVSPLVYKGETPLHSTRSTHNPQQSLTTHTHTHTHIRTHTHTHAHTHAHTQRRISHARKTKILRKMRPAVSLVPYSQGKKTSVLSVLYVLCVLCTVCCVCAVYAASVSA